MGACGSVEGYEEEEEARSGGGRSMEREGDAACVGMDQCVNGCCLTRTAPNYS